MKNPSESRIAIIAALPGELKPLVQGWQQTEQHVWTGSLAGHPCMAIAGGIGAAAATHAAEHAQAEFRPDVLVSYGWAGALTCALKPGMACGISEVIDAATGRHFATANPSGTRLLTLDHVARSDEKRKLAERHQTVIVDMEAAAVARFAADHQIPFHCFKGISDGYNEKLPDFNNFIDSGGRLRMMAFLLLVAVHPQYWGSLQRLGKMSRISASGLARLAPDALRESL
jgi:adenosylhomocysteine nucleosidase